MAHNTRVFDPPVVFAQTIGPAELNALDVLVSESLNADQGGVWAPVTPIIIGGAGVNFTGPSYFGDIRASSLNGVLTVNQPIVPTGIDGHVAPKLQTLGNLNANVNLDDTYDTHSIGDLLVSVTATVTFTGGGLPRRKRIYTRAKPITGELILTQTALAGILAIFPSGASKCWIELVYNGLAWEVAGYGGGTTI